MIKEKKVVKGKNRKNRDRKTYVCLWCGTVFKQWVGTSTGGGDGKRNTVSTQVSCPRCKNFIAT